ncbi:MAG: 30S ribosomal protein S11 [Candidatus Parcubacteria bacterium]|nr:MAG: 30S ribosomal protein S11 [Candidatus Parcubacteria bacterium]
MGQTRVKVLKPEAQEKETIETQVKKGKKKKALYLPKARIYINANFNNTIITLTDDKGNVIAWSSAGHAGLKHTKKGTPFAGTKAMEVLLNKMEDINIDELEIYTKGVGPGRETALRVLFSKNYNVSLLQDITPIPFGGPTKPKPRRV